MYVEPNKTILSSWASYYFCSVICDPFMWTRQFLEARDDSNEYFSYK